MKCVHRGFPNTEISGTALFAATIWLGKRPNHHRLKTFFFAGKDIPLLYYYIAWRLQHKKRIQRAAPQKQKFKELFIREIKSQ